jgi:PKD repeat protein
VNRSLPVAALSLIVMLPQAASQLSADFSATPASGTNKLEVQFSDLTTGGPPTTWFWDFGDGQSSTQQHPLHIYDAPGVYTVTLQVLVSIFQVDTETKVDFISVGSAGIQAAFTAAPQSGPQVLEVAFQDTTTTLGSPPDAWHWDFGDGSHPSGSQNPPHSYVLPGVFDVSLTVWVGQEFQTLTVDDLITVTPADLLAPEFQVAPVAGRAPLTVHFDVGDGGTLPAEYVWEFGDGAVLVADAGEDVVHNYQAAGTYSVTVTAEFGGTTETTFLQDAVFVQAPNVAAFASPVALALPGAAESLVLADLGGDAVLDLMALDLDANAIVALESDGSLGVSMPSLSPIDGVALDWRLVDLNLDGDLDAVVLVDAPAGQILPMYGDGSGGFTPGVHVPLSGQDVRLMDVGDAVQDGLPEVLVLASGGQAALVPALPGGAFGPPISVTGIEVLSNESQLTLSLADVDADGLLDLSTSIEIDMEIWIDVLRGDGTGNFAFTPDFPTNKTSPFCYLTGGQPTTISLLAADVDGDGVEDSVGFYGSTCKAYAILSAGSNGAFGDGALIAGGTTILDAGVADLDANGFADPVWLGSGTIRSVYLNHNTELNQPPPVLVLETDGEEFELGDLDGDGVPDIALLMDSPPRIELRINELPGPGFLDVGGGVAGSSGLPQLIGHGTISASEIVELDLSSAAVSSLSAIVAGLAEQGLPFKGGTLVPSPDWVDFGHPIDATGTLTVRVEWPAGLGPGFSVWTQAWIIDSDSLGGWSASNGLRITSS